MITISRWMCVGFVGLVILTSTAQADRYRNKQIVGDTTVTNSVGGTDAWGFGSTDVDINDCLYSWSFLFGLVQGTALNKWCAAERYMMYGAWDNAAEMRCSMPSVKRRYKPRSGCFEGELIKLLNENDSQNVSSGTLKKSGENFNLGDEIKDDDNEDDHHEEYEAHLAQYEALRADFQAQIDEVRADQAQEEQARRSALKRREAVKQEIAERFSVEK